MDRRQTLRDRDRDGTRVITLKPENTRWGVNLREILWAKLFIAGILVAPAARAESQPAHISSAETKLASPVLVARAEENKEPGGANADHPAPPKRKPPLPFDLRNGSMAAGTEKPEHWTDEWIYHGKIAVTRDTEVFTNDNASLRLATVDGPAKADVRQIFDGVEGVRFHLQAKIRAEGNVKVLFGVISYNDAWIGIGFNVLGSTTGGAGWNEVSGIVTLPAKTRRFAVTLSLDGEGQAWLDEVKASNARSEKTEKVNDQPTVIVPTPDAKTSQHRMPSKARNAWSPAQGFFPEHPDAWQKFHTRFLAESQKGKARVVFLGDSLTQGWPTMLWDKFFTPLDAVNYGIGGDGTPQILWRVQHGELQVIKPQAVVLMVGINNLWPGYSADHTAKGIRTIVETIRAQQPNARILLLGILPIFDPQDAARAWVVAVNRQIALLADNKNVYFLDLGKHLLEADGTRKPNFYAKDKLHLQEPAYEVISQQIEASLREWIK